MPNDMDYNCALQFSLKQLATYFVAYNKNLICAIMSITISRKDRTFSHKVDEVCWEESLTSRALVRHDSNAVEFAVSSGWKNEGLIGRTVSHVVDVGQTVPETHTDTAGLSNGFPSAVVVTMVKNVENGDAVVAILIINQSNFCSH